MQPFFEVSKLTLVDVMDVPVERAHLQVVEGALIDWWVAGTASEPLYALVPPDEDSYVAKMVLKDGGTRQGTVLVSEIDGFTASGSRVPAT